MCIHSTAVLDEMPKPASQVTSIMRCLTEVPLETILGRPLLFSWFISFDTHLMNIKYGPGRAGDTKMIITSCGLKKLIVKWGKLRN